MWQKHTAVAAVRQQLIQQVLQQASVAQKAAFRRKQVAALQVQAVYRGICSVLLLLTRVRILMLIRSFHHLELLHHLVQVALNQVALAAQQISSFQVRLANRKQVVAPNFLFLKFD
jgi:hypothetical protein